LEFVTVLYLPIWAGSFFCVIYSTLLSVNFTVLEMARIKPKVFAERAVPHKCALFSSVQTVQRGTSMGGGLSPVPLVLITLPRAGEMPRKVGKRWWWGGGGCAQQITAHNNPYSSFPFFLPDFLLFLSFY
jgi:hypothetical protein